MPLDTEAGSRIRELEKRAKDEPKNAELAVTMGEAYLRENRVEDATAAYARAAELDPRSELKSLYWEWLGGARESRGELEEALQAYLNWAESEPAAVEPLDRVGTLLVRLQRWTDIVLLRPHYLRRREQGADPHLNESLALYGFVLDQLGSPEDVTPLERTYAALEEDADSVSMRYLLGVLFYRTEHMEAARAEFERVLELDEDGTWREERFSLQWDASAARLMLARIARLQGDPEEALTQLSESLKARAGDDERLEEVASLLLDYRRYREALGILPELAEQSPGWVHQYRAEGLLGLGRLREAESSFLGQLEPVTFTMDLPADEDEGAAGNGRRNAALDRAEQEISRGKVSQAWQRLSRMNGADWRVGWARARCLVGLDRWPAAMTELEALVAQRPALEPAWELLVQAATRAGQPRIATLARVQRERLRSEADLPGGILVPVGQEGAVVAFLVQARSITGKGALVVTGEAGPVAQELGRLALTLLQTRYEAMGLDDPAYRILHLHVSALYHRMGGPGRSAQPGATATEEESRPTLGEHAGGAVVAALGLALLSQEPEPGQVVLGRIDLEGRLSGPVDLTDPLNWLQGSGYAYKKLVLPRTSASELLRTPPALWLVPELGLVDQVEGLLAAVNPRSVGART